MLWSNSNSQKLSRTGIESYQCQILILKVSVSSVTEKHRDIVDEEHGSKEKRKGELN